MKDLSNKNIIQIIKEDIQYLQFRKLLEYKDIITHAYPISLELNFSTNTNNTKQISENEYEKSTESYKKICNSLKINYKNIVKANQEHTDNIVDVKEKINKDSMDIKLQKYKNTDGLITNKKNIILSTTNADCIIMLFFDPVTKTIANVHSGWRGTLKRISVKTVKKMIKDYKCNPKDIICCICPSIRQCHFEVDVDVKDLFEKEFQDLEMLDMQKIIQKQDKKEKWNIDTVSINKIILERQGLKRENIIDCEICSVCNSDLIHSYRVEKQGFGLSTALIALK